MRACASARQAVGWLLAALVVSASPVSVQAQAADEAHPCGPLKTGYGPYDYRTATPDQRRLVEGSHFTARVETLIAGESTRVVGADIDYTLRAFPNHHRALVSMMRYGERLKNPKPPGAQYTVDCYFDRAIRMASDDNVVRMLFAGFLSKQGRETEAEAQLKLVADRAADNPFTLYNLGMVYFDLKRYEPALEFAHKAAALGFPRTELMDKLKSVGKWSEPAGQ
jgi:hypothetical protein